MMSLDNRVLLRRTVVTLTNNSEAVTTASVSLAAGVALTEFYPSVEAVYADIIAVLVDVHAQHRPDTSGQRRRSASQGIAAELTAFWTTVVLHPTEHRAMQVLRLTTPELAVAGPEGTNVALRQLPGLWAARWLEEQGAVQGLTWLKPVPLLAQWVVATLDGLLSDHLSHPERTGVMELLELFAYHLAQQGTRNRPKLTP